MRCSGSSRLFSKLGRAYSFSIALSMAARSSNGQLSGTATRTAHSRGSDESLAHKVRSLKPSPVSSVLAVDTTRRPWYGRKAFGADCRFALDAATEAAVVNPAQSAFYLAQERGLTVRTSNCRISLRRVLNLVHLVSALFDGDAVPVSQYLNQFGFCSFQDLFDPTCLCGCCLQ
jgi:hypothetical protein